MAERALQVIFRGEAIETIEKLQKETGANTKTEVVKDALFLYDIMNGMAKDGKLIVSSENSSVRKLITLPQKKTEVVNLKG